MPDAQALPMVDTGSAEEALATIQQQEAETLAPIREEMRQEGEELEEITRRLHLEESAALEALEE